MHRTTAGVDLDLFRYPVVCPCRWNLHAARHRSAEAIGAPVAGALLISASMRLEIAIVDAADIAERVRGELAQRVLTKQARLDFDAGESVAVGSDDRDFLSVSRVSGPI